MRRAALFLLLGGVTAAQPLAAQAWRRATVGIGATGAELQRTSGLGTSRLSGLLIGGEVGVALGKTTLEVGYRSGSLSPDTGSGTSRDLIVGRAMLGLRPTAWLTLAAGAHARSLVTPGGTVRWLMMEVRARVDAPVAEETALAYLEIRQAVSGNVTTTQPFDGARGGEAGLRVRIPRSNVWMRLAYTVERSQLTGGALTETLEGLGLSVGLGGR